MVRLHLQTRQLNKLCSQLLLRREIFQASLSLWVTIVHIWIILNFLLMSQVVFTGCNDTRQKKYIRIIISTRKEDDIGIFCNSRILLENLCLKNLFFLGKLLSYYFLQQFTRTSLSQRTNNNNIWI